MTRGATRRQLLHRTTNEVDDAWFHALGLAVSCREPHPFGCTLMVRRPDDPFLVGAQLPRRPGRHDPTDLVIVEDGREAHLVHELPNELALATPVRVVVDDDQRTGLELWQDGAEL